MPTYQIGPGQRGVYEIPADAGTQITVAVPAGPTLAQVIHHTGDAPAYVAVNGDAQAGDPNARMVTPGSWIDVALDTARSNTVNVVTRSDATISVTLP